MTEEEYIKDRLNGQIDWYDRRSRSNQTGFHVLRIIELIAASSIPLLASYATDARVELRVVVGLLGVIVAVLAGLLGLYKFQENWIAYRATAETLQHEKYLFQTKCEPYNADEPFNLLVQRVEAVISREHRDWQRTLKDGTPRPGA